MANTPKEIEHYLDLFKDYTDERLISITLRYAPQLEYHIAARLLLEKRKGIVQNKTNAEILKAAKGANRWAKYAFIVAVLSLFFLVAVWIYEHSQSLIDTPQQIEKVTVSPKKQSTTNKISEVSSEKPQLSPKQLKTKNKLSEK